MSKGQQTRDKMIAATARLLAAQGYNGTGVKEILRESQTPRGSFYFHFPGGKEELACTALKEAGKSWRAQLLQLTQHAESPGQVIDVVCTKLAEQLVTSNYCDGCPVATVVLEAAAQSDAIQTVVSEHFIEWRKLIAEVIVSLGVASSLAPSLATLVLSSIEGALLLARAERSRAPLDDVSIALRSMFALLLDSPRS